VSLGLSILALLGVAFVILKTAHQIDWSWWWVTAPFWGPAAIWIAMVIFLALMLSAIDVYERLTMSKQEYIEMKKREKVAKALRAMGRKYP
jgi:hypothetical protein